MKASSVNPDVFINNDAIVFGLLAIILAFIFQTHSSPSKFWKKFYKYCPALLLCYFLPSVFSSLGIISSEGSKLYYVASRYLLPASLVLLTLSIDFKELLKLGSRAVIMFLVGTLGIVLGGPLALWIMSFIHPEAIGGAGPDAVWRGLTTLAGSWIGGGANMTAMKELFQPSDQLFSAMIAVDVMVAQLLMTLLLLGAGKSDWIDQKILKADNSTIKSLQKKMEDYSLQSSKIPKLSDVMLLLGVAFGLTALGHLAADLIAPFIKEHAPSLSKYSLTSGFFWLIVTATTGGLILSFTSARKLEGVGASRIGSVFIYILVVVIGMSMDLSAIFSQPSLFLLGGIWLGFHALLMFGTAKLIKAPFFLVAVGSQANVGGAASAPVMASAFHPSLAPVGVLMAVLGYALGTYGAWLCGVLMQMISAGAV